MIEYLMNKFLTEEGSSRSSSIVQAGNFFLKEKGKNRKAENFLRSFLLDRACKGRLLMAVEHLKGDRRNSLANEIKENCYVFLFVCWSSLELETQLTLCGVCSNPPHVNFHQNTNNKIKELCRKRKKKAKKKVQKKITKK